MRKCNILLILSIFFLFFITFVSAAEPDLYFKQGEDMLFKRPCWNNGTYCSSASLCNWTLAYPNKTLIVDNKAMTYSTSYFNYTLIGASLPNGDYDSIMSCCDGGVCGAETLVIEVNPTGIRPTDMRTSSNNMAIWIVFIICIAFFVSFMMIDNPPVKYSFLIMSMIFLVMALNLTFVTLSNEIIDPNILNVFDIVTASSFYFYWFATGILFIIWVLTIFNTMYERFSKQRYDKFNISMDGGKYG